MSNWNITSVEQMYLIACQCLNEKKNRRPDIKMVLEFLPLYVSFELILSVAFCDSYHICFSFSFLFLAGQTTFTRNYWLRSLMNWLCLKELHCVPVGILQFMDFICMYIFCGLLWSWGPVCERTNFLKAFFMHIPFLKNSIIDISRL